MIRLTKHLKAILAVLAVSAVALPTAPAVATSDLLKTQAPGFFRTRVGDFEVTTLYDGGGPGAYQVEMFKGNPKDVTSLLQASFADPKQIVGSVSGFLVNTGEKLILVDTGSGGHWFAPVLGKLASSLVASGYRPDQVDLVLITHLHADHAAGITSLDGKRVFPNAEVWVSKADADFWLSEEAAKKAPKEAQEFFDIARKVSAPYIAAGKWRTFEGAQQLATGVKARPISGHTPGHTGYEFTSKDQKMLVWGDVVHLAPVQLPKPEIAIAFDIDSPAAVKARQALFKELAANKTLIAGAHMPFPAIGRLRVDGKGYAWVPVNYVGTIY
jgi:glyoxylase-like metal-dependent hydrolase (beta-lactamase superfamily II)